MWNVARDKVVSGVHNPYWFHIPQNRDSEGCGTELSTGEDRHATIIEFQSNSESGFWFVELKRDISNHLHDICC